MPLTPQQNALCQKLERQVAPEIGVAAAALIRQQASEIDSLWDRLTHAYMAMRGEVGDDSSIMDECEELGRSGPKQSARGQKVDGILPRRTRRTRARALGQSGAGGNRGRRRKRGERA
jgi:hypothetical protein